MSLSQKNRRALRNTLFLSALVNLAPQAAYAEALTFKGLLVTQRDITHPQKALAPTSALDEGKCPSLPPLASRDAALPPLNDDAAINAYREQLKTEGSLAIEPSLSTLNKKELLAGISPLIGQPLNQEVINKVRMQLLEAVNSENTMLADIYFPPQTSNDGYVVAVVAPAKVGKINTVGQEYFSGDELACEIRNRPGTRIDLQSITSDLQWLNRTPWRVTDTSFSPGDNPGEADITLTTQDRLPFRPYISMDNSGTNATGMGRYRYGFSWGNAFDQFDHRFDYSYTMSSINDAISGHNFSYSLPVWHRTSLMFAFSHSDTDVYFLRDFRSRGQNTTGSLSLNHVLPALDIAPGLLHEVSGGIEYKRIGNNAQFGQFDLTEVTGSPKFRSSPELAHLFFDYSMGLSDSLGKTNAYSHFVVSPGFGFGNNTDEKFTRSINYPSYPEKQVRNQYWYWRQTIDRIFNLPEDWSLRALTTFQYTTDSLLYSERMGLTGMYGVRGYYSDTLFADRGIMFNIELTSPTVNFNILDKTAQFQGFIFNDWGKGFNQTAEYNGYLDGPRNDHYKRTHEVSSVGVGGRLTLSPYVQMNGSIGFPLHTQRANHNPEDYSSDFFGQRPSDFMGHFSIVLGM